MSQPKSENPFQSPMAEPGMPPIESRRPIDPRLIHQFRQQILALGFFWIFIGGLAVVLAIMMVRGREFLVDYNASQMIAMAYAVVLIGMGIAWVAIGILTCLKQLWAVYTGLVLSYLSLLAQLIAFNFLAVVILLVVILQAHRVIIWANRLRADGVSLSAKHP